jgi:hypothetical protein
VVILLLLLCGQPALEIPTLGRPTQDFYGMAGGPVQVVQWLAKERISVDEYVEFQLRIKGVINPDDAKRPALKELDFFRNHFQVETPRTVQEYKDGTLTFFYRLRAIKTTAGPLPGFALRYFDPRGENPAFRLTVSNELPLVIDSVKELVARADETPKLRTIFERILRVPGASVPRKEFKKEEAKYPVLWNWFTWFDCQSSAIIMLLILIGMVVGFQRWNANPRLARRVMVFVSLFAIGNYARERYLERQFQGNWATLGAAASPREGNGNSYPAVTAENLPAGWPVRLLHTRGDWQKVEFAHGQIGWLPEKLLQTIATPP